MRVHLHSVRAVEAFRQVDAWGCEHVAVGVTGRVEADVRRCRAPFRLGVGDEARHGGRDARRRRGGARRPRRGRRPARLDVPAPAGARLRAAVRGRRPDRAPGPAADLLELRASTSRPALVAERAELPFAEYVAAVWGGTGIALEGPAGSGMTGTLDDAARACARAAGAVPARARDAGRGDAPCSSPGLDGRPARASAARSRTTGGSASSCATARARTGPASRNSPRDVRPLRPQRHLPVGRSGGRHRARLPDRPAVRRLGGDGLAAARRRGARRARLSGDNNGHQ